MCSDDGIQQNPVDRRRLRTDKLLRMRQYNSLPTTPADGVTEGLTEMLDMIRRQRSNSHRTDSSLSDGGKSVVAERELNELATSLVSKFELSDEDGEKSNNDMEVERKRHTTAKHRTNSTTLRSVFCHIL